MPHLSFSRHPEGWILPIVVGINGRDTANLLATGQPIPPPQLLNAQIDTGSDISAVAASVLSRLGLRPVQFASTRTIAGSVPVDIFEVSLSIPHPSQGTRPIFVTDQLLIMEATNPLSGIDALLGLDVLDQVLTILDGPRREATLAE
jgi:hypothetical protein